MEGFRGAIDANPVDREEAISENRFGNWNCRWDRMIPLFGRHSVVLRAREKGMN